jgi:hypothetical protein
MMHVALIDALYCGAIFIFVSIGKPATIHGDGFREMIPQGVLARLFYDRPMGGLRCRRSEG